LTDDANYSIIGIGVSLNVGAFDGDEVTVIGFNTVNASAGGGIGGGISDVSGPGSSTDNAVTRYDGTTGKLIQNSLGGMLCKDYELIFPKNYTLYL
jgi:hypothetical protein